MSATSVPPRRTPGGGTAAESGARSALVVSGVVLLVGAGVVAAFLGASPRRGAEGG
ncbi:hypothetical protein [Streptomyces flavalbus]|uniref:Uncharacterized protein n=1 Tax=Streptomyces flavalbus TaxID=2665155 RepID=A0ABW2WA32_9ACTN